MAQQSDGAMGRAAPRTFRIGVDIGGTFTDFTAADGAGKLVLWKEDSTPDDPARAIFQGLHAIAESYGTDVRGLLGRTSLFVHGSTIATNAVLQRDGAKVGLLCTDGFRDVLYLRDGYKPDRFNLHLRRPPDLVERYLRLGVEERINARGEVVVPLNEEEVRQAAGRFRDAGVEAVGITFLWSIVNPVHEKRAQELIEEELPEAPVLCSSDVLPEIREWERTSATALSAYVLPRIGSYLRELEAELARAGLARKPLIMQVNGGCASVDDAMRRPVYLLASGPAAAPAAASHHARDLQDQNIITVDMGGTSFDVCLLRNGRPAMTRTMQVQFQPIGIPAVEVHSIGAGGGSIAWIDTGGALRVGPRSAGAKPGPACYGAGGHEATVTDANVVLGRLAPDAFLGGRRVLHEELAREAVRTQVAEPLGITLVEAAAGIIEVVNASMVDGIRAVSVERGFDPRQFTLVAGGGAGGLHASRLARQLGIRRLLIPPEASTFCSFGMTVTDVRHDYSRPLHRLSTSVDPAELDLLYHELERVARSRLQEEGFSDDLIVLDRSVDARYPNQVHELTVAVPTVRALAQDEVRMIALNFHIEHQERFSYALRDLPVEFLHWRLTAIGRVPVVGGTNGGAAKEPANTTARLGERDAYSEGSKDLVATPVYSASLLPIGGALSGPAIIQSPTTTVLLNSGDILRVTDDASFLIDVGLESS